MKKYITPKMKISMFQNITQTAESTASSVPGTVYIGGLEGVADKTQVTLSNVREITKFIF